MQAKSAPTPSSPSQNPGKIALFGLAVGFGLALAGCSSDAGSMPGSRTGNTNNTGATSTSRDSASTAAGASAASSSTTGGSNLSNPPSGGLIVPTGGGSGGVVQPKIGPNGEETCASGMQSTSPVTPTVWLVIDGSSSMDQSFEGGNSRWLSLRSTLMDPGGVVDSLNSVVRFGMVIYSGGDPNNCVQLVTVDPELNNHDNMAAQYPMAPIGRGTPTDKALEIVVNNLAGAAMGTLDAVEGPTYLVLATDGAPNDSCGGGGFFGGGPGGGGNVEQRVVDITAQGTNAGLQMYVISMAGGDGQLQAHLDAVANATISQTPPFVPGTQSELISAFQSIVGGASCLVSLEGTVEVGKECSGSVLLNSEELTCNGADGWMLFDPRTVQLTGTACDTFKDQQSMVIAKFPCEVFSPN